MTSGCSRFEDPENGAKSFSGNTPRGLNVGLMAQVTDVTKTLLSVSKMIYARNKVVFQKGSSYIENLESGSRTPSIEDGHVDKLHVWSQISHSNSLSHSFSPAFRRQPR